MPGVFFPVEGYGGKVDPHWGSHHGAADLFAPRGTPVRAMRDSRIISVGSSGVGGNNIILQGDDGLQYYYAHLDSIAPGVKAGANVPAGTPLGGVGDTGNAKGTGTHLHIGIGKSILNGTGPAGGAGSDFDATAYLQSALQGGGGTTMGQMIPAGDEGDNVQDLDTQMLTPERLAALAARHGGTLGTPTKVKNTEKIKNPNRTQSDIALSKNEYIDNPNPTWRIEFADGKYVLAMGERDDNGEPTGNLNPIGGTGLTPVATTGQGGWHWAEGPGGTQIAYHNNGQPVLDADGNTIQKGSAAARGGGVRSESQQVAEAALADERRAAAALARARAANVGVRPPSQVAADQALVDERGAHVGLYNAETEKAQLEALVAAQKLIPKQMQAFQEAEQTLNYIHQQVASGAMGIEEANRAHDSVIAYMEAGLRGTTPAEEEKLRQQAITARAGTAAGILNQRVSSGASLAGSLYKDYQELLTKAGGFTPEGTTLEFNPLRAAVELTNELGGGPQMSELAQILLQAANPNAQGMGTQQPQIAAPVGGGLMALGGEGENATPVPNLLQQAQDIVEQAGLSAASDNTDLSSRDIARNRAPDDEGTDQ